MFNAIPYNQAFNLATYCMVADEFLKEYGSAIQWQNCKIDLGELMAFIEEKLNRQ